MRGKEDKVGFKGQKLDVLGGDVIKLETKKKKKKKRNTDGRDRLQKGRKRNLEERQGKKTG